jgi:hypothetical protein
MLRRGFWRQPQLRACANDAALFRQLTSPPVGRASSELILFDVHRSLIAGDSYDRAFNNKSESYAIMQTYRPVDTGFNELSWQKEFASRKQQTLAADIQALADTHRVQKESSSHPPALDRQPQRETPATAAIGDVSRSASLAWFQWLLQFCFAWRQDSPTGVRSARLSLRTFIVLTPLQHSYRQLC